VNAEELPYENGSFDHAACLGTLLYFKDPKRAMSEIHRVTKPGGRLVLRTVNRNNLYTRFTGLKLDPDSYNLYTESELTEFIQQCGFRVEKHFSYGFWPPFATQYWWYLINTVVKPRVQDLLSLLTPPCNRVNLTIFAVRN